MVARSVRCRSSSPLPAGGEVERPVQPVAHGAQRHHRHLSGRQLDPERQPVQAAQHLHDVRGILRGQLEVGPASPGVLDERADPRLPAQGLEVRPFPGHGQRLQPHDVLPRDVQGDPRGGQHPDAGRVAGDGDHELAAGVGQVLAVVEHQQQVAVDESSRDVGRADVVAGGPQPECRCDRLADPLGTVDGGEMHDHDVARCAGCGRRVGGHVEREPGLADATGARDGHGRVGPQQPEHLLAVVLAAHEWSRGSGNAQGGGPCGRQRGEGEAAAGHHLLQIGQRGPRVQAGLLDQPSSVGLRDRHRLGGAAVRGECPHVQQGGALAQWLRGRGGDRVDGDATVAECQPGLHEVVDESQAELVQPDRLDLEGGQPAELGEGRAAPQVQGAACVRRGGGGGRARCGRGLGQPAGRIRVQLVRLQQQAVAGPVPLQPVGERAQMAAHPGDVVVERLHGVAGWLVGPQAVDQPVRARASASRRARAAPAAPAGAARGPRPARRAPGARAARGRPRTGRGRSARRPSGAPGSGYVVPHCARAPASAVIVVSSGGREALGGDPRAEPLPADRRDQAAGLRLLAQQRLDLALQRRVLRAAAGRRAPRPVQIRGRPSSKTPYSSSSSASTAGSCATAWSTRGGVGGALTAWSAQRAHGPVVGVPGESVRAERDQRVGAYVVEQRRQPARPDLRVQRRRSHRRGSPASGAPRRRASPAPPRAPRSGAWPARPARPAPAPGSAASPRVAVTQTARWPCVAEGAEQPAGQVGLVVGVRPEREHGAEVGQRGHARIVACEPLSPACHAPASGSRRAATGPCEGDRRTVVGDGRHRGALIERNHA